MSNEKPVDRYREIRNRKDVDHQITTDWQNDVFKAYHLTTALDFKMTNLKVQLAKQKAKGHTAKVRATQHDIDLIQEVVDLAKLFDKGDIL